jgi:type I restriction enzyme, S subunit
MSVWPETALSEVLSDAAPGFACGEDVKDGVFQFRMNNITAEGQLDLSKRRRVPRDYRNIGRFLVQPGDVLFNATNSPDLVGKTAFFPGLEEPAVFSNHFLRLRPRGGEIDGRYLTRWLNLQFLHGRFKGMCRQWVNQATVGRDALLSLKVPLPPLAEQRRIAEILDKADALRAKRRAALTHLDSLTQSIFVDMFGDPVANPRSLPVRPLSDVGTVERGVSKHRPRNAPELLGGPFPFVQTGDVANCDGYIRRYSATYSDIGLRQSRIWPAGTLCITIAANIAKTGILTFDACFPDSVVGFRAQDPATVEYVRVWLSFLQETLERSAPESAQKNINLEILRALKVPIPPIELQRQFADRLNVIEGCKVLFLRAVDECNTLFGSLQHRAFLGNL